MRSRLLGLALALAALAACGPAQDQPTPTLIVMGLSLPTTTPFATYTPQPTETPIAIYTNTPTIEPPPTHTPSPSPTITSTPSITGSETITPSPPKAAESVKCSTGFEAGSLLLNGGFEEGAHTQGSDTILVPDGWSAFWRPEGTRIDYDTQNKVGYQTPDIKVISKVAPYDNPSRILDGNRALTIKGDLRVFDAGVYQKVTVSEGETLCLSGSGQAWSNRFDDDLFTSTLDTPDDENNANFQLGIDPGGGGDAFAPDVEWSSPIHQYNIYKPMYVVEVKATSPVVTVFVRGYMKWRFNHNEMFFDSISLVKKR